jgi:hypothetical protein
MRFDDTIATVLASPVEGARQRAARWRQLVDLVAQRRSGAGSESKARVLEVLRAERPAIAREVRLRTAEALAGRTVDPELLVFFAEDEAAVAAPVIGAARLDADEWRAILPRLGAVGRAFLRHRRDLDAEVVRALAAFGAADFVLSGTVAGGEGESQIRELVERIEAFRRNRGAPDGAPVRAAPSEDESFRWETGADGVIRWVEGAARGAIVGQAIAFIAGPGQCGVDGQAAGAFEKRAPFRDARFRVAGEGPASGDWRISGVPFFDPARGAFRGYRGTARRPRLDEVARPPAPQGMFGGAFPADSLRQLVHELRTPLNAITGFAELIEGQYMGPAGAGYRARAERIVGQARALLSAIDDLDTAARIETRRLELSPDSVDAAALLDRLHGSYDRLASQRGVDLTLDIAPGLPPAAVDAGAAERMFARIFSATIGVAGVGESIPVALMAGRRAGRALLSLAIARPRAIEGLDEAALLDPGYSPEGDWPDAPALGLGFALRLVRNLAEATGGTLAIGAERIVLSLPAADLAEAAPTQEKEA